jgi:hypothetical protein
MEWARTFRVDSRDIERIWQEIVRQVRVVPISGVRDLAGHGVNCRIDMRLTIGARTATVRTIWHYAAPNDPPRLVTAFPRF